MNFRIRSKIPGSKIEDIDKGVAKKRGSSRCYAVHERKDNLFFIGGKFVQDENDLDYNEADSFQKTLESISESGYRISEFTYYLIGR